MNDRLEANFGKIKDAVATAKGHAYTLRQLIQGRIALTLIVFRCYFVSTIPE